jgi:hypothetical protein
MVTRFGLYSGHNQTKHYFELKKKLQKVVLALKAGRDLVPLTPWLIWAQEIFAAENELCSHTNTSGLFEPKDFVDTCYESRDL